MKIITVSAGLLRPMIKARPKNSHKGDYGRLLIAAGSRGMTGAALIAARAALRAGAGLVTLACPASEQPAVAAGLSDIMTFPVPSSAGTFSLKGVGSVISLIKKKQI